LLREQALGEGSPRVGDGTYSRRHEGASSGDAGKHGQPGSANAVREPSPSAPVFPNNRGGHMNAANWYRRWFLPVVRTLAEGDPGGRHTTSPRGDSGTHASPPTSPSASVYAGVTFHSLRHSFISMMAAAGAHPSVIAQQVGHADGGALVLRRYRHLFPQEGRHAADRLDAYLRETS